MLTSHHPSHTRQWSADVTPSLPHPTVGCSRHTIPPTPDSGMLTSHHPSHIRQWSADVTPSLPHPTVEC
ncbi:hypothetical protein ACOMHN_001312 [Nucella lapillus]